MTLTHPVHARNDAVSSENKIHDDSVARRYGFGGGLVPGVTVFGYLTWLPVSHWGPDWLTRGAMAARFESPVYDGDDVDVVGEPTGDDTMDVRVASQSGQACATGTASLPPPSSPPFDVDDFSDRPAPDLDNRPPADETSLAPGTALGAVTRHWDAGARHRYLELLGDDLDVYERLTVAHPGGLVRAANDVLARNVRLGPWIHVGTDARWFGVVLDDETVTTYGRVVERFERKGHQFVVLDVLSAVGDRVVLTMRHTAIYEPRQVTGPPSESSASA